LGAERGSYSVVDVSKLNDVDLWIGRSHYDDGTANASYDEIRLWSGALSEAEREKLHLLGPDQVGGGVAISPQPRGTDVPRDTVLSWNRVSLPRRTTSTWDRLRGGPECQ